ncbi:MAG: RAMP superfamily protein [Methanoregula sp. PtaU1.Bin051]|nr:MAG: RAMP superfamily protein [Methanoregula sp. PtaU1.Bin051]
MKLIEGIITAASPLHLGDGQSRGTFMPTLQYIPGRTLRGMVGYYLFKYKNDLFTKSGIGEEDNLGKMKVIFRNAYPVSKDGSRTVAAPLSVRWCKKCGHQMPHDHSECDVRDKNGRLCLHEGKKYSGLISVNSFSSHILERPDMPSRSIETKCPITRDRHSSPGGKEQGFDLSPYHIESIDAGAKFSFRMLVEDGLEREIIESLNEAAVIGGIGGFRSRGYGIITFGNLRSAFLNDVIREKESRIPKSDKATLVATAPMILKNGNISRIGFDDLFIQRANEVLQVAGIQDTIALSEDPDPHVTTTIARGWSLKYGNSLSELIPCIGMGSSANITATPRALATLDVFGIGEKINYGYGEIYVLPGVV